MKTLLSILAVCVLTYLAAGGFPWQEDSETWGGIPDSLVALGFLLVLAGYGAYRLLKR